MGYDTSSGEEILQDNTFKLKPKFFWLNGKGESTPELWTNNSLLPDSGIRKRGFSPTSRFLALSSPLDPAVKKVPAFRTLQCVNLHWCCVSLRLPFPAEDFRSAAK